jgi:Fe2+ or Zn2+ uptake regulation protein
MATKKKMTEAAQQGELKERIRATGLKFTGPRAAVLRVMESAKAPLTHADVVEAVASHGIESPTVYRNLMDLYTRQETTTPISSARPAASLNAFPKSR